MKDATSPAAAHLNIPLGERAVLFQRARKLRAEIAQIFVDADHWNSEHGNDERIDPDPDGQLRRLTSSLDKMIAGETPVNTSQGA